MRSPQRRQRSRSALYLTTSLRNPRPVNLMSYSTRVWEELHLNRVHPQAEQDDGKGPVSVLFGLTFLSLSFVPRPVQRRRRDDLT